MACSVSQGHRQPASNCHEDLCCFQAMHRGQNENIPEQLAHSVCYDTMTVLSEKAQGYVLCCQLCCACQPNLRQDEQLVQRRQACKEARLLSQLLQKGQPFCVQCELHALQQASQ